MSLAFGILEGEKMRLENLPQESMHIRKINGKQYLYSIKRRHNKVISSYVGECSIRRLYKQRKKEALANLKEIVF